ncbi:MAG: hypothetical protein WAN74_07140, partial [Thermoplasmata archaeon]
MWFECEAEHLASEPVQIASLVGDLGPSFAPRALGFARRVVYGEVELGSAASVFGRCRVFGFAPAAGVAGARASGDAGSGSSGAGGAGAAFFAA